MLKSGDRLAVGPLEFEIQVTPSECGGQKLDPKGVQAPAAPPPPPATGVDKDLTERRFSIHRPIPAGQNAKTGGFIAIAAASSTGRQGEGGAARETNPNNPQRDTLLKIQS